MSLFLAKRLNPGQKRKKNKLLEAISGAYRNFCLALAHQQPEKTPVVLWYTRTSFGLPKGAETINDYYFNPDYKLAAQIWPMENFPGLLTLPGVFYDFGLVVEPSGFGCPVTWFDHQPPSAGQCLDNFNQISSLKMPDFNKDGLFPKATEHYKHLLGKLDPELARAYPVLQGGVLVMGPMETARAMVGASKFFLSLLTDPQAIKDLLAHVTKGLIAWLHCLEEINGGHRLIATVEHTPCQISLAHCREFFVPFVKKIRQAFPEAVFLYHNEGPGDHYMEELPGIGADIFHCQDVDLIRAKKKLGSSLTLQGTLHPLHLLRDGSPEDVFNACMVCMDQAAAGGGGFLLSQGGGLASPEGTTPLENIRAILKAAQHRALNP